MTWAPPWDYGISWRSEIVTPGTEPVLTTAYVRDKVLRVANGSVEDSRIASLILAATDLAEQETQRALPVQTRRWIGSGFPCGAIVLPAPPLVEIVAFDYIDADGAEQSLFGSPAQYLLSPSGRYTKARITPLAGEEWPSTEERLDAVTIDYTCGYSDFTQAPAPSILTGIELAVEELYNTGSCDLERLRAFWRMVVDG